MPSWIARAAPGALLALVTAAILSLLFLATSFWAASADEVRRVLAVRQAFATGELVDRDYLKSDWRRGKDQYNDCVVLQLVINRRGTLTEKALAPIFYASTGTNPEVCRSLRQIAYGAGGPGLSGDSYSRYWHGYVPLSTALLAVTDVSTARQGLRLAVIAALLALIAVAARAGGTTRVAGISVGVTGLLFWGLPYYGQGLSFAPADAVVMSGIAALIALRSRLQTGTRLAVFSAAYGSLVAYLDFLTGPLPTGACLIFLFAYLASFDSTCGTAPQDAWRNGLKALAAYALGAVATLSFKQLLVLALLGPDELNSLLSNARLYSGLADSSLPAVYLAGFWTLFKYTPLLTCYSIAGGAVLLLCSALSWLTASYFVLRSEASATKPLFLAHAVGAGGIALWVLLLPGHTALHGFMTRMLVVPLAFGWSALALQLRPAWGAISHLRPRSRRGSARTP